MVNNSTNCYYNNVTWVSLRYKSSVIVLFVRLFRPTARKPKSPHRMPFVKGIGGYWCIPHQRAINAESDSIISSCHSTEIASIAQFQWQHHCPHMKHGNVATAYDVNGLRWVGIKIPIGFLLPHLIAFYRPLYFWFVWHWIKTYNKCARVFWVIMGSLLSSHTKWKCAVHISNAIIRKIAAVVQEHHFIYHWRRHANLSSSQ